MYALENINYKNIIMKFSLKYQNQIINGCNLFKTLNQNKNYILMNICYKRICDTSVLKP